MSSITSHLARIEALAFCFDNASTYDMEAAAKNLANNCPAFWHRATSGNAVVGGFLFYLARTQDVIRAWELYEHEFQSTSRMRSEDRLDELLPLNPAAAKSLARAYDELGWPRREAELIARTDKAEAQALDAILAFRRDGVEHPLITAMGGIDWRKVHRAERAVSPTNDNSQRAA